MIEWNDLWEGEKKNIKKRQETIKILEIFSHTGDGKTVGLLLPFKRSFLRELQKKSLFL